MISTLPPVTKSIAVLPFVNMSADPDNEYFSDGMTEEIINALTNVKGLKVIARTTSFAFKGKELDVRTIGKQLGVSTVLEGSVRKAANRVRISAQLIGVEEGTHLWSKSFDRELEDIFELQDEISLLIADKIRENFGHLNISDHLIHPSTQNLDAYNLYLKGRYFHLKWDETPLQKAIQYYKASIEQDPSFPLPYFGIGYCLTLVGAWGGQREFIELAATYIDKGLAIDQTSFFGHFVQGALKYWGHWDYKAGTELYQKAIQLNPHFTEGYDGMAEILINVGRFDEAMEYINRSIVLSPHSANHFYTKGAICFYKKDYEAALEWLTKSLTIDPGFPHPVIKIALCHVLLKQEEQLRRFLDAYADPLNAKMLQLIYQLHSRQSVAEEEVAQLLDEVNQRSKISLWAGPLYLLSLSGQRDRAWNILQHAVSKRIGYYANFRHFPLIASVRKHPGFKKLAALPTNSKGYTAPEENITVQKTESAFFTPSESEIQIKKLEQLMADEKPFTENSLSLRELAEKLNLHPNKLSWLINKQIGKNFNEYINTYRLETFKAIALNPENSHLTLLGLAHESGFNSKTIFNAFFKKMEGITPRAWVKQHLQ